MLWEKEKLLVKSNFSFSHSVFKRLVLHTRKNQGLFGKGLMKMRCYDILSRQCSQLPVIILSSLILDINLCPWIKRLGAYCFTVVCPSVCPSVCLPKPEHENSAFACFPKLLNLHSSFLAQMFS